MKITLKYIKELKKQYAKNSIAWRLLNYIQNEMKEHKRDVGDICEDILENGWLPQFGENTPEYEKYINKTFLKHKEEINKCFYNAIMSNEWNIKDPLALATSNKEILINYAFSSVTNEIYSKVLYDMEH